MKLAYFRAIIVVMVLSDKKDNRFDHSMTQQQPANLSVNLNKVALLRNARALTIPSVVGLAEQCIEAGAHGITVHPRPDERHIRRHDVDDVAALLRRHPTIEYNIEGNPFTGLMEFRFSSRPISISRVNNSRPIPCP